MLAFYFAAVLSTALAQTAVLLIAAVGGLLLFYHLLRRARKSRFVAYGVRVRHFVLPHDGKVDLAEWEHPKSAWLELAQDDVDFYRRYIADGDFAIDVGAYSGDKTVPMALAAGASGCVLAIEPNPHVFAALERNAALNRDKTNIVAVNIAATDQDGAFTFHYSDGSYCNGGYLSQIENQRHKHRYELTVVGRNLERLLRTEYADRLERLAFIKTDAEGYDRHVIRSLTAILKQYQPVLVCEVYKHLTRAERDELFDELDNAGYDLRDEKTQRGERLRREDLYQDTTLDILAVPRRQERMQPAA